MAMQCPKCGKEFESGKFCLECGAKLIENETEISGGDINVAEKLAIAKRQIENEKELKKLFKQDSKLFVFQKKGDGTYILVKPKKNNLTEVVIHGFVSEIGEKAFESNYSLKSVTICNGVKIIGDNAFNDCRELKSVTLGNSLTDIGVGAFSFCWELKSVTMPKSVTHIDIGWGAFESCISLKNIALPDGVTRIPLSMFRDCSGLERITIPASVTHIDEKAFYECKRLKTINYKGNESQWQKIDISWYNNAPYTINYNYEGE
ncbi:MAG: leucine-rich repeat domain-containing protein [Clostridiales bacterium]|nr:leucine-rich repeat domain-containing protein [Clostridiales bacterium]